MAGCPDVLAATHLSPPAVRVAMGGDRLDPGDFFNSTGVFMGVEQNLKSALAIVSFTANFAGFYGSWLAPNDVYWSLSLEEQFYFLFPFFCC